MKKQLLKKQFAGALALAMAATCLPVSADEAEMDAEQVLNIVMAVDPTDWDPCNEVNTTTVNQLMMEYDGLVRMTENGDELALAESYEMNDDATVYTFKIREDAKFEDGSPLTAYDVEYTWLRAIDPEVANDYAWYLEVIKGASDYMYADPTALSDDEMQALKDAVGIEATDEYTLVVTLNTATPYFLTMLTHPAFFVLSQDFIESNDLYYTYGDDLASTLSSGPFKMTGWENDVSVTFEKNENYWDADNVYLTKINMDIISESSTEILKYESNEVDTTFNTMSSADSNYYADSDEYVSKQILATGWAAFNCDEEINEKNGWPLADANVRKALVAAIDHDTVASAIIGGGVVAATGFIPTSLTSPADTSVQWNNGEAYMETTANVEKAKEYLEAAGWTWEGTDENDLSTGTWYKDGEAFPVIEVNMGAAQDYNQNIATAWIGYWNAIGIQGALDPEETAARTETRENAEFMVTFMGWGADYADASTFLDCLKSTHSYNYGRWCNDEFDSLMATASSSVDQQVRYESMLEAESLIFDEMPVLMYQFSTTYYLQKPYLKGVFTSSLGYRDFKNAYISGK